MDSVVIICICFTIYAVLLAWVLTTKYLRDVAIDRVLHKADRSHDDRVVARYKLYSGAIGLFFTPFGFLMAGYRLHYESAWGFLLIGIVGLVAAYSASPASYRATDLLLDKLDRIKKLEEENEKLRSLHR